MEGQTDSKPKILSPKAAPLMYTGARGRNFPDRKDNEICHHEQGKNKYYT